MKKISILIPCHNEEHAIPLLFNMLNTTIQTAERELPYTQPCTGISDTAFAYEILCIDDGSTDNTCSVIKNDTISMHPVTLIELSRNFGKESAILAGLEHCTGDCAIILDADMQDPPDLIPKMLSLWTEGYEVIHSVRVNRTGESPLRALFGNMFYSLHNTISTIHLTQGIRDFCCLDRKAIDALRSMPEYHRFTKGMITWIGYKTTTLTFEYKERSAGTTSWRFRSLFSYAVDGFISFSTAPLRSIFFIGLLVSVASFLWGICLAINTLVFGNETQGWTSIMVTLLFLAGIQFTFLGIISEYIARIYEQNKNRPIYLVSKITTKENTNA